MSRIALVLAGSGVKDGSEIHEATLTLLYLNQLVASVTCFAPDRPQFHVVNHLNDHTCDAQQRSILEESARIARGAVLPIDSLDLNQYDALVFPGGFGAAKNLCDYAFKGTDCTVYDDIANLITQAHKAKKTLGFMCIAPVLAAKLIPGVTVTVGEDNETAQHIVSWGAHHQSASVNEAVWDEVNQVASTPAYMLGTQIHHIAEGIEKLCQTVVRNTA